MIKYPQGSCYTLPFRCSTYASHPLEIPSSPLKHDSSARFVIFIGPNETSLIELILRANSANRSQSIVPRARSPPHWINYGHRMSSETDLGRIFKWVTPLENFLAILTLDGRVYISPKIYYSRVWSILFFYLIFPRVLKQEILSVSRKMILHCCWIYWNFAKN